MIETTTTGERLALVFHEILIERLEDQARWREAKADDWPGDPRNQNCAEALWTAADVVRQFEPHELPAVRSFVAFARLLEREGIGGDPWALADGSFIAGRFHFDGHRRDVAYVDVIGCLNEMFRQSLTGYADALEIEEVTPGLRRYFKAHGVPLDEDEGSRLVVGPAHALRGGLAAAESAPGRMAACVCPTTLRRNEGRT